MERFEGIFFLLDGKEFAFKTWPHVPRVGDWVVFPTHKDRQPYEVVRVIWRENRSPPVNPYVEVEIKKVKS
jgi:hypothetical protein